MNSQILIIFLFSRSQETGQISDQNKTAYRQLYLKLTDNLKPSSLYEKKHLSYETMNEIYKKSTAIPNFAKNAMVHLFDKAELLECMNVRGIDKNQRLVGRFLDEARVETIRQMVKENAGDHNYIKLWQTCIARMNQGICRFKKSRHITNNAEE